MSDVGDCDAQSIAVCYELRHNRPHRGVANRLDTLRRPDARLEREVARPQTARRLARRRRRRRAEPAGRRRVPAARRRRSRETCARSAPRTRRRSACLQRGERGACERPLRARRRTLAGPASPASRPRREYEHGGFRTSAAKRCPMAQPPQFLTLKRHRELDGCLHHRPRRPLDRLRWCSVRWRSSGCSTSSASDRQRRRPMHRRRASSCTRRTHVARRAPLHGALQRSPPIRI